MHRGKRLEPYKECDWCNKTLPALRHPKQKFCSFDCRSRERWNRENVKDGIKCLVCSKMFNRVGSHVVQVHGYENVLEYKREFGLNKHETRTKKHAESMKKKLVDKSVDNLEKGAHTRYEKGKVNKDLEQYWINRKSKEGYKKIGSSLRSDGS